MVVISQVMAQQISLMSESHKQMIIDVLGCMPKTPHLDELAKDAIAFTKTYMMGSFISLKWTMNSIYLTG